MAKAEDPRVTMVGSVTGNDNTVGGGGVYPIADLHDLDGFKAGFKAPIEMADGYDFIRTKAYKDSKLCLMMMSNVLHSKYHKLTGIAISITTDRFNFRKFHRIPITNRRFKCECIEMEGSHRPAQYQSIGAVCGVLPSN